MSDPLTINPAHLADGWLEAVRDFLETAKENGEVVQLTRAGLLTPAEVAKRLGMSRTTVLRRIADGHRRPPRSARTTGSPFAEFERYSRELMRQMAEVSVEDIGNELRGG